MDKGEGKNPEVVHGEAEMHRDDRTLDAWAFFRGWVFYVKMSASDLHSDGPTPAGGLSTIFNGVYHQPGEMTRFHTFSRPIPASSRVAFDDAVADAIRVELESGDRGDRRRVADNKEATMIGNVMDVHTGMEVYGRDGEKIGTISEVYPTTGTVGSVSPGTTGSGGPGVGDVVTEEVDVMTTPGVASTRDPGYGTVSMPAAAGDAGVGSSGYVQVDQGGVLGIGTRHLYIPFSAVTDVVPGENVTVDCTKDQCGERYATKPGFLADNSAERPIT
jgi:hypothetical protein